MGDNFPRGPLKTSQKKRKIAQVNDEEREVEGLLFENGAKKVAKEELTKPQKKRLKEKERKKRKKEEEPEVVRAKRKKSAKEVIEEEKDLEVPTDSFKSEPLTVKNLCEDMLVLGAVSQIHVLGMEVCLPGNIMGHVKITDVSDHCTRLLQDMESGDADLHQSFAGLSALFKVGDLVVCRVKNVTQSGVRFSIELSINPTDVNKEISAFMLRERLVLPGSVKSEEDHGYTIDIGIKGTQAFLSKKDAKVLTGKGKTLPIGSHLHCIVTSVKSSGRSVSLSVDPTVVSEALAKKDSHTTIATMLPGTKVMAKIKSVEDNHLEVSVLKTFIGHVDSLHLDEMEDTLDMYSIGQKMEAVVIYQNPVTKTLGVSIRRDHFGRNILGNEDAFSVAEKYEIGAILEDVKIVRADKKKGLLFELSKKSYAFVHASQLSDDPSVNVTDFQSGLRKKCRIQSFDLFNLIAIATMKESIIQRPFLTYKDIRPGTPVKGQITAVLDEGLDIQLQHKMRGFVPRTQLADIPITNIKDMFHEGVTLELKVLSVVPERQRIILTHKKTLLNSTLPMICSYDQVEVGMVTHGYVAAVKVFGCIVAFYNSVRGLLHKSEMSNNSKINPMEGFYIGQVVKVKVIESSPEQEQIKLSIKQLKKRKGKEGPPSGFKIGKIVKAKVVRCISEGVEVITLPDKVEAFIPTLHLSDDQFLATLAQKSYQPGNVINEVMFWSFMDDTSRVIASCKKSILKEVSSTKHIVEKFSDLQPGLVTLGYIRRIMLYGAFVELPNNIVGLCPKTVMSDDFIVNASDPFDQGQTVRLKVTEVDEERKRFLVSMKSSEWIETIAKDEGLDLLEEYFSIIDKLREQKSSTKGLAGLLSLKIGSRVKGHVTSSSAEYTRVELDNGARGVVPFFHYSGSAPEVGDSIKGCILDIDLVQNVAVLSLREDVMVAVKNAKKKQKEKQKSQSGVEDAKVVLTSPCFILTIKEDGGWSYLTTKMHLNDHASRTSQVKPKVGDTIQIITRKVLNGRTFGVQVTKSKLQPNKLPWDDHTDSAWSVEASKGLSKDQIRAKLQRKVDIVSRTMGVTMGQKVEALVKIIKPMFLCVETKDGVPGMIHISEITDEPINSKNPLTGFNLGEKVTARITGFRLIKEQNFVPITHPNFTRLALQLTVRPSKLEDNYDISSVEPSVAEQLESFSPGQKVWGFVRHYSKGSLNVSVSPTLSATVHRLNLSKSVQVLENPSEHFKPGQAVKTHLLHVDHEHQHIELTMTGSSSAELKPGLVVNGRVAQIRKDALYLQLPGGFHGYVHLCDIRDHFIDEPLKGFKINQFCRCSILDIQSKDKVALSLRPSRVSRHKDPGMDLEVISVDDVKPGELLRGYVKAASDKGIFVSLSRNITGRIMLKKVSAFYVKEPVQFFPEGKLITVKVLEVKRGSSNDFIELSCSSRDTGLEEVIPKEHRGAERQKASNRRKKGSKGDEDLDSGVGEVEALSDSDVEIISKSDKVTTEEPRQHLSTGLSWQEDIVGESSGSKAKNPGKDDSEPSDDEEEEDPREETKVGNEKPSKKKSKKQRADEEKAEEDLLFQTERNLMDSERAPETLDDFDRLAVSSPDSSLVWIRYMAYHLQFAQTEKARAVAERALKTISFREEQEKLNVWVAYMNLENLHGTEETLLKVFERALQNCEPIKVFNQLIDIYIRTGKVEDAEKLHESKVKRFKQDKAVWIDFGTFLMKNGKFDTARRLMQKSFKTLPQKDHVDIISKFAQHEYKYGEPERGQTMFENVLSNYPKRTDVWSVYLDMMIKHGDRESTRRLFERVITLKLAPKKIKFFFKRYLDFEKNHGTEDTVNAVKQKVLEYVALGQEDER